MKNPQDLLCPPTGSVWIVTAGRYSDKYIVGIYTDEDKAKRAYAAGSGDHYKAHNPPIEYPLNGNLPINDNLIWVNSCCDAPTGFRDGAPDTNWIDGSDAILIPRDEFNPD